MPALMRVFQSGRNQLQATRINGVQSIRGMFGGRMGLEDVPGGNGTTPPAAGFAGLGMGIWQWPIVNKIQGGEGFMPKGTAAGAAGLGNPSNAASQGQVGRTGRTARGVY